MGWLRRSKIIRRAIEIFSSKTTVEMLDIGSTRVRIFVYRPTIDKRRLVTRHANLKMFDAILPHELIVFGRVGLRHESTIISSSALAVRK